MKTFRCNNCGHQLQRPTQPYKCPQCGGQAVGLFKLVQSGHPAPGTMPPGQPGMPTMQPGTPLAPPGQPGPPPPPGIPAGQPGATPPSPPGLPAGQYGSPPTQPGIPPGYPGVPPTQGGVPPALPGVPPAPAVGQPKTPPPPRPPQSPPREQPPVPPQPPAEQPPTPPAQKPVAPTPPRTSKPTPPEKTGRPAPQPPEQSTPPAPAKAKRPKQKPAAPKPEPPKPKPRPKPVRPEQFAWAFPDQPPPEAEAKPMGNAPAVDSTGRIYLHVQGRLVALEEKEGKPEICWEYVTGSHAPGPVVVAPDGTLRLHCTDAALHCLSFEGKQVYAPVLVGEPLGFAAPVADQDGNTWISAFEGGLIKVDAEGRIQKPGPYFRSRQRFDAPGIIHEGVLYVGSEDGYVFAVELGEQKGKNLWNHADDKGYTGWYIHSAPAVNADGILVVTGRDEHVYGFAPDGRQAFKTAVPGQMLGSPVLDKHGHIYVGVSQSKRGQEPRGVLVCLDGNSHKIRWEYKAAGPVESTPVIGDDDLIYFGDNAARIHAVDFRGQGRWTAQVQSPVRSAGTILAPGHVAFGLDNETLMVLKCSSQGLAQAGWPKIGGNLGQCGLA